LVPGRRVVILGSGDIGLIMARRFTLEGVEVEGVYEIMDHPGGLTRNIVQCLHDFDIPLHLAHTVTFIHGRKRVEAVTVSEVDENLKPIGGTERLIPCDTLVLSVGLIPENELSKKAGVELDPITAGPVVDSRMETSVEGFFACGNVVNVFDLVDYVTDSAEAAGEGAAEYVQGRRKKKEIPIRVVPGKNVKYVVPQFINSLDRDLSLYFRVEHPERAVSVRVSAGGRVLSRHKAKMVRPPEMVHAHVPSAELEGIGGIDSIEVEVIGDEE
jgi:NADPH-dependent 2,4-dienoyl-CoA reductase/sulfur reductase-like enzyme